ncbi:hypothetical protein EVAR_41725_1 [Eumeta japonica]|uniref:Uncharacterized protein n=1 Tax=Eumeta variegata TaxID=151549 RepID=A0A4C1XFN9_EUMVA|nr:hypothetical protein EVAR_41725_1 [Eumeta japonica]
MQCFYATAPPVCSKYAPGTPRLHAVNHPTRDFRGLAVLHENRDSDLCRFYFHSVNSVHGDEKIPASGRVESWPSAGSARSSIVISAAGGPRFAFDYWQLRRVSDHNNHALRVRDHEVTDHEGGVPIKDLLVLVSVYLYKTLKVTG